MFFNTNLKVTKSISFFLAFLLIINSFLFAVVFDVQKAQAQLIVSDPANTAQSIANKALDQSKWVWDKAQAAETSVWQTITAAFDAWDKSDTILSRVSYSLMYITVQIMLTKMTQNIVGWSTGKING